MNARCSSSTRFRCVPRRSRAALGAGLAVLTLGGCQGVPSQGEREAQQDAAAIGRVYRPDEQRPALPTLSSDSELGEFLRFALLNQPTIEAAYYDWAASVQRITIERSLPDPRLTFESDIADMVMS